MFAEVIYEPGSKSVMQVDSEDELKSALSEQHRRAVAGELGGPTGHAAERVTKVFLYDYHPADFNAGGMVARNKVGSLVDGMADESGNVDANQLVSALRDELSPVYPLDQGRHESMYKMEGKEIDLSFLNGSSAPSAPDTDDE